MTFMNYFCFRCKMEKDCEILSDTLVYDVDDQKYPKEWTYDNDGDPVCEAFKK